MVSRSKTVERTFSFIDLAGFTALTEAHGDNEAVALLDRFLAITRQSLGPADQLVKTIGDAVMLASRAPQDAISAVTQVMVGCHTTSGFPLPRAGIHHGNAIARDGDYIGSAVNLAARVAGHACGGQLLATIEVAAAARLTFDVVPLGPYQLRNVFEATDLFDIRFTAGETSHTIDPVCRMHIGPEHAAGTLHHNGHDYWFCSLECVAAFAADPVRYTRPPGRH